jgi:hypothetical protein
MDPDEGSIADLKEQAAGLRSVPSVYAEKWSRFERFRYRLYLGLLIFVVVVGLPILGIPSLRHRLVERVQVLKDAIGHDGRPDPLMARIGENRDPFPKEYEIPVLKRQGPPGVIYMADRAYSPGYTGPSTAAPESAAQVPETAADPGTADADAEPEFRQGPMEKQAYDLLLQSKERVAGMVQGKDAALRFKDWSAARIEEDLFYVRVTFIQASDKAEVPYIWQVRLESKQVTPLNYHARSVPN